MDRIGLTRVNGVWNWSRDLFVEAGTHRLGKKSSPVPSDYQDRMAALDWAEKRFSDCEVYFAYDPCCAPAKGANNPYGAFVGRSPDRRYTGAIGETNYAWDKLSAGEIVTMDHAGTLLAFRARKRGTGVVGCYACQWPDWGGVLDPIDHPDA